MLGRLIDSSINNRLSVMLSDYRIVRSVIDESNCFCACASISLSIQYIHHYFFLINKTGILQYKTAQELRNGKGKRANAKQVHCFHCREVGAHEKPIVAYCNNTTNLQQHLCTWHPEVLPSTSSLQTTRRIVTVYSRQCLACR